MPGINLKSFFKVNLLCKFKTITIAVYNTAPNYQAINGGLDKSSRKDPLFIYKYSSGCSVQVMSLLKFQESVDKKDHFTFFDLTMKILYIYKDGKIEKYTSNKKLDAFTSKLNNNEIIQHDELSTLFEGYTHSSNRTTFTRIYNADKKVLKETLVIKGEEMAASFEDDSQPKLTGVANLEEYWNSLSKSFDFSASHIKTTCIPVSMMNKQELYELSKLLNNDGCSVKLMSLLEFQELTDKKDHFTFFDPTMKSLYIYKDDKVETYTSNENLDAFTLKLNKNEIIQHDELSTLFKGYTHNDKLNENTDFWMEERMIKGELVRDYVIVNNGHKTKITDPNISLLLRRIAVRLPACEWPSSCSSVSVVPAEIEYVYSLLNRKEQLRKVYNVHDRLLKEIVTQDNKVIQTVDYIYVDSEGKPLDNGAVIKAVYNQNNILMKQITLQDKKKIKSIYFCDADGNSLPDNATFQKTYKYDQNNQWTWKQEKITYFYKTSDYKKIITAIQNNPNQPHQVTEVIETKGQKFEYHWSAEDYKQHRNTLLIKPCIFGKLPGENMNNTLENFIPTTDTQKSLLQAAREVIGLVSGAQKNATIFIITGAPGCGKTHISSAIAKELLLQYKISTQFKRQDDKPNGVIIKHAGIIMVDDLQLPDSSDCYTAVKTKDNKGKTIKTPTLHTSLEYLLKIYTEAKTNEQILWVTSNHEKPSTLFDKDMWNKIIADCESEGIIISQQLYNFVEMIKQEASYLHVEGQEKRNGLADSIKNNPNHSLQKVCDQDVTQQLPGVILLSRDQYNATTAALLRENGVKTIWSAFMSVASGIKKMLIQVGDIDKEERGRLLNFARDAFDNNKILFLIINKEYINKKFCTWLSDDTYLFKHMQNAQQGNESRLAHMTVCCDDNGTLKQL